MSLLNRVVQHIMFRGYGMDRKEGFIEFGNYGKFGLSARLV